MKKKIQSGILYQGPSRIDGAPIVVIAIAKSTNSKTGNMVQTYILRADMDPITANRTDRDYSICGRCVHRGKANPEKTKGLADGRSCYVTIGQGAGAVYRAFLAGKYPILTDDQAREIGRGRMIRLGTYGDPAAIYSARFEALLSEALGHTGYTHQLGEYPGIDTAKLMISADNARQAQTLHNNGYRTFRVIPVQEWKDKGASSVLKNEILCPASEEAGRRVTCEACKLCSGSSIKAKSIAIVSHGSAKSNFKG